MKREGDVNPNDLYKKITEDIETIKNGCKMVLKIQQDFIDSENLSDNGFKLVTWEKESLKEFTTLCVSIMQQFSDDIYKILDEKARTFNDNIELKLDIEDLKEQQDQLNLIKNAITMQYEMMEKDFKKAKYKFKKKNAGKNMLGGLGH